MRLVQIVSKIESIKTVFRVAREPTQLRTLLSELHQLESAILDCEAPFFAGQSHQNKIDEAHAAVRELTTRVADKLVVDCCGEVGGDADVLAELEDDVFYESEVGFDVDNGVNMTRVLQFNEVESVLERFDGQGSGEAWCTHFEENATQYGWDATLKSIYARRLLDGRAKDWIEGKKIYDYANLVKEIKAEFQVVVNIAEIAETLRSMLRHRGEKAVDYLFRVNKVREHAGMDFNALQYYMVRGIDADVATQTAIMKTKTWQELREHLQSYDSSVAANAEKKHTAPEPNHTRNAPATSMSASWTPVKSSAANTAPKAAQPSVRQCFVCGEPGHLVRECPNKRCFKCNEVGHFASNCPVKAEV